MKYAKKNRPILAAIFSVFMLMNCSDDDNGNEEYKITQSELDAISEFIESFTGGQMAHGGPDGTSPDSTVREVFASTANLSGSIPVGTIVTKNTYKRGADGNKTDEIYVSFAMVKREAGYYPDGGDWEYIMMPNDGAVDYNVHPFGILPDEGSSSRGKLTSCAGCHSSGAGGDFLYVND